MEELTADRELMERADAARELMVIEPTIDRYDLLAAVVWPSKDLHPDAR